jgi:hypothetical protein
MLLYSPAIGEGQGGSLAHLTSFTRFIAAPTTLFVNLSMHFTSGLSSSGTGLFTIPISVTTLQVTKYGDSLELLGWLELLGEFELEDWPELLASTELLLAKLEEEFSELDDLGGAIETESNFSSSNLPMASSIFCCVSPSSSIFSASPLPHAIRMIIVDDIAKISDIGLMNLNFFNIIITFARM